MPRKARIKSETGIYHVVFRGINRQRIFEDEEDYNKFVYTLKDCKEKSSCELYAYCLMSNHVHLLLKEVKEGLPIIFRRIGAKYVYWYNWKYARRGHLFQDRYKSEAVEDDRYFLTALRYIHQNPLKAGMVKKIEDYPWSSYGEYMGRKIICDTYFALSLFGENKKSALVQFKKFNQENNDEQCLEYDDGIRLNDAEAAEIIKRAAGVKNPFEIQNFTKEERNELIRGFHEKGLSIRQVERLTGIRTGVIRGILKQPEVNSKS